MLKGGHNSFEVVLTQELEVLALLNGAQKVSTSLKGRVRKVVPCLKLRQGAHAFLEIKIRPL